MGDMVRSMEATVREGTATPEFEDFFRDESVRLGKALYLLCGDEAEAEDLVQEAMARAYERWPRVRTMASPTGYVYRVALNLHRRRFRRARLARRAEERPEESARDPALTVSSREEILTALRSLSVEQREAVVLVEWLGLGAEEAGSVLGVKPESVRSRLHRARTALRERLGGNE
jgi:RNA polymerase sigma-70 factor (ECF subfamily)